MPEFADDLSLVEAPRVLAVSASPAEAEPGAAVTLTALVADASGTVSAAPLDWSLCRARRPLAELGPVARACLEGQADAVLAVGAGPTVEARVPDDVCRRFGPDPPPTAAGQAAGRPVDPDGSGGYYQPVLVDAPDDALALFQLRVRCGAAGATQAEAAELRRRYRVNTNPEIVGVEVAEQGVDDALLVAAGEEVVLVIRWPDCPAEPRCGDGLCTLDEDIDACAVDCTDPRGCGGAETYLRFDPEALALTSAREAMRVAWYATAGGFATTHTGRAADDTGATSTNTWTAPAEPGPATIWIVVRDERGGASWRTVAVEVR